MILLTKKLRFSAAHRLFNPEFSDEKNYEVFGVCANPNGHGHNYELEVTISGDPDPKTGMILDLKLLKIIVDEEVINHLDHKHLNFDVPFLKGIIPTAENVAAAIWNRLVDKIPAGRLHEIRLFESDNNFVTYSA